MAFTISTSYSLQVKSKIIDKPWFKSKNLEIFVMKARERNKTRGGQREWVPWYVGLAVVRSGGFLVGDVGVATDSDWWGSDSGGGSIQNQSMRTKRGWYNAQNEGGIKKPKQSYYSYHCLLLSPIKFRNRVPTLEPHI